MLRVVLASPLMDSATGARRSTLEDAVIRRLLRTVTLVARTAFRGSVRGALTPYRPRPGEQMMVLSPGRRIDDPDEAEALGLTADARRLRRQEERPSTTESRFPPGFIDRINQGRRP